MMLGLEENRLRVVAPEVGGGFGSKLNVYAEEALMGFVAMKINKPVKWIESRRENFLCTIHGRGHVDDYEIAAKNDGTILGIKLKIIQDLGAYHQLLTPAIPTLSVLMMPGLYRTPEHSRRYRRRVHQLRSDRCVSRRGTSGGDARDRAHGGHAGGRIEDGPGGDPPEEFRPATTSFRSPRPPGSPTIRATTRRRSRRRWTSSDYKKLREEQAEAAQAGPADGHRHFDVRRNLRASVHRPRLPPAAGKARR